MMASLFLFLVLPVHAQDVEGLSLLQLRATSGDPAPGDSECVYNRGAWAGGRCERKKYTTPDGETYNIYGQFSANMSYVGLDQLMPTMGWDSCPFRPHCGSFVNQMRDNWGCTDNHGNNEACRNAECCNFKNRGGIAAFQTTNHFAQAVYAKSSTGDVEIQTYNCPVDQHGRAQPTLFGGRFGDIQVAWSLDNRPLDEKGIDHPGRWEWVGRQQTFRISRVLPDGSLEEIKSEVLPVEDRRGAWASCNDASTQFVVETKSDLGKIVIQNCFEFLQIMGGHCDKGNDFIASARRERGPSDNFNIDVSMRNPLMPTSEYGETLCTDQSIRKMYYENHYSAKGLEPEKPFLFVINPDSRDRTKVFTEEELDRKCKTCLWCGVSKVRGCTWSTTSVNETDKWEKLRHQAQAGDSVLRHREGGGATCEHPGYRGFEREATPEETCKDNGCSWIYAQKSCKPLQNLPEDVADLYTDCLLDLCVECKPDIAEDYKDYANEVHKEPMCLGEPSAPAICSNSFVMNLAAPAQSNLGGLGPDSGDETLAYTKAGSLNGKWVDLVVTSSGDYTALKPEQNGVTGSFGQVNYRTKRFFSLKMEFKDTDTGAPVQVPATAVSFYDLDEGKKGRARTKITANGATAVCTAAATSLTVDTFSVESSLRGTAKNNPTDPLALTAEQMSLAATFAYGTVSEINFELAVAKGPGARNVMFAIRPSLACNAA